MATLEREFLVLLGIFIAERVSGASVNDNQPSSIESQSSCVDSITRKQFLERVTKRAIAAGVVVSALHIGKVFTPASAQPETSVVVVTP